MNRYMVAFSWKSPPDLTLAGAEHQRVEELIKEGRMEQVLLAEDRTRGWLVMLARDESEALSAAATLPFYPSMRTETTLLVQAYP